MSIVMGFLRDIDAIQRNIKDDVALSGGDVKDLNKRDMAGLVRAEVDARQEMKLTNKEKHSLPFAPMETLTEKQRLEAQEKLKKSYFNKNKQKQMNKPGTSGFAPRNRNTPTNAPTPKRPKLTRK